MMSRTTDSCNLANQFLNWLHCEMEKMWIVSDGHISLNIYLDWVNNIPHYSTF